MKDDKKAQMARNILLSKHRRRCHRVVTVIIIFDIFTLYTITSPASLRFIIETRAKKTCDRGVNKSFTVIDDNYNGFWIDENEKFSFGLALRLKNDSNNFIKQLINHFPVFFGWGCNV